MDGTGLVLMDEVGECVCVCVIERDLLSLPVSD